MDHTLVGTSRCDVPARAIAGGTVAPLNAARTAQRAVPTGFMVSRRLQNWRSGLSPGTAPLTLSLSPSGGEGGRRPGEGATPEFMGAMRARRHGRSILT